MLSNRGKLLVIANRWKGGRNCALHRLVQRKGYINTKREAAKCLEACQYLRLYIASTNKDKRELTSLEYLIERSSQELNQTKNK